MATFSQCNLVECLGPYRILTDNILKETIPNAAKAGGLQSQGVKGEIVVVYLDPLTTQDLKFSDFPEG